MVQCHATILITVVINHEIRITTTLSLPYIVQMTDTMLPDKVIT